ncbi:unnamed protein product [Rotaria magnacalcarata]|uniref:Chitin-binding type-2 domain-containing protein n=3 Tax=Rotaria magnacalcarata TaxID=392030 RepID=A0A816S9B3_9BILA|nr:unnamed protein product [Rotaria magnacalcarata]
MIFIYSSVIQNIARDIIDVRMERMKPLNAHEVLHGMMNPNHTTTTRKKSDTESVLSDTNAGSMNGKDNSGNSPAIECQPTGIYSIPDPTECNSYYQCDKGTRTKLGCPERKLFDTEKRECNDHERVTCGARAINLSDKNQCVSKRDGIHPDPERDCHFYYQCFGQNKMREARCPGDQKFSSYTGRCGPANAAPIPCGSFIPGNAAAKRHWNSGIFIPIFLTMVLVVKLNF